MNSTMATPKEEQTCSATIGPPSNQWHFHSSPNSRIFDLTHTNDPSSPGLHIPVSTGATIKISPPKSALVIIDMQNYFLSAAMGRPPNSPGHKACDTLIRYAIPAARRARMQIVFLNWGVREGEMAMIPPAVTRCFGIAAEGVGVLDRHGQVRKDRTYAGLGAEIGIVRVPSTQGDDTHPTKDEEVDAGRLLFADTWNTALYPPLKTLFDPSSDIVIPKSRISGLWSDDTPLATYLRDKGLRTLFFAGVNTDQCVGSTLSDAFSRGYDCVMLRDGCGTSSPEWAQRTWEYNVEGTFGFVVGCEDFYGAVMG